MDHNIINDTKITIRMVYEYIITICLKLNNFNDFICLVL